MALHLCIDVRMLNASGIGTFIKNLLPHLIREHHLSLLYDEKDEEEVLTFSGCNLIPMKSRIYTIAEQFELPRKIPKCDLFFSPHYNIPLLPIKAKKRLVKIHDVTPLVYFSSLSLAQKIYAKLFFNAALLISDAVTTVSYFSSNEIGKYCFVKKSVTPIANSIAHRFTRGVSEEEKERVRQKYALPFAYLLWVGNVKPHKNLARLIDAYEKLHPKEDLLLMGEKEHMRGVDKAVIKRVEEDAFLKERVRFTGYIDETDVPALYALAKLCVFPSLYEGFGFPPLEALAMGCPSVVSNVASMPEVCQDAVEYVDPHCVDSIAGGIEHLLGNAQRRVELLEKGKALLEKYTPENSAKDYLELLATL